MDGGVVCARRHGEQRLDRNRIRGGGSFEYQDRGNAPVWERLQGAFKQAARLFCLAVEGEEYRTPHHDGVGRPVARNAFAHRQAGGKAVSLERCARDDPEFGQGREEAVRQLTHGCSVSLRVGGGGQRDGRSADARRVDLLHLAVPTSFYEEQTGTTFRARLRDLNHEEFRARGDLRELYLPKVHVELRDLATALGERSPKTEALMSVLREQVDRGRNVMLVARTATLARVHRAYLAKFPEIASVR